MGKSKIEWTDETWNPLVGCNKVSQGCKNCYALQMSARIANQGNKRIDEGGEPTPVQRAYMDSVVFDTSKMIYVPKWTGKMRTIPERLEEPLRWRKPRRVFVNSMSDLFHPDVPFEFIDKVFATMILAKDHIFQVLTKRPGRMAEYLERVESSELDSDIDMRVFDPWRGVYGGEYGERPWPASNIWLGTSVENQEAADERIPHLLQCPAAVRFLSCEPLLGPVDITNKGIDNGYSIPTDEYNGTGIEWTDPGDNYVGIDWVIVGGESGHNARPMHPEWARAIRDQCQESETAFFFKQWGKFIPGNTEHFPLYVGDDNRRDTVSTKRNPERDKYKEVEVEFEQDELPWIYFEAQNKVKCRKLDGREWNQMPEVDDDS